MIRRSLLVAAFPLLLLCLLAAERIATLLLGQFPANSEVWRFWIWLHSSFGELWTLAGPATGHSYALQLVLVALAIGLLLWATGVRKWMPLAFLANHLALIMASIPVLTANRSALSSLKFEGLPTVQWILLLNPNPLSSSILLGGLVSCALCHWAFLSDARGRQAPVEVRLRELRQNL